MMSRDQILYWANYPTYDRQRAEAMGFQFEPATIRSHYRNMDLLRMDFRCVCGTREILEMPVPPLPTPQTLDLVRYLRVGGSFSREHLLRDGYSSEQIYEFERKAAEFDAKHGKQTFVLPPHFKSVSEYYEAQAQCRIPIDKLSKAELDAEMRMAKHYWEGR